MKNINGRLERQWWEQERPHLFTGSDRFDETTKRPLDLRSDIAHSQQVDEALSSCLERMSKHAVCGTRRG